MSLEAGKCVVVNQNPEKVRMNTVRCNFSFLRRHLCVLEQHDFVEHYLRVPPEKLELMQWNGFHRSLFLKLRDPEDAYRLVSQHNGRHSYPPGRLRSRVYLSLEDSDIDVVLFDLSELVSDEQVHNGLSRYGVVIGVRHNTWGKGMTYGGIYNGQRVVRMVVRQSIPSIIRIGGELTCVTYPGQHAETPGLLSRILVITDRAMRFVFRLPSGLTKCRR